MSKLLIVLTAVAIAGFLAFGVWWEFYQFHDCRKVGHSKTYCIIKLGD